MSSGSPSLISNQSPTCPPFTTRHGPGQASHLTRLFCLDQRSAYHAYTFFYPQSSTTRTAPGAHKGYMSISFGFEEEKGRQIVEELTQAVDEVENWNDELPLHSITAVLLEKQAC